MNKDIIITEIEWLLKKDKSFDIQGSKGLMWWQHILRPHAEGVFCTLVSNFDFFFYFASHSDK